MSVTMTYLFSFASIAHDKIINSSDMVSELASSFVVYSLCGQPSAQPCAFIVLYHFSFRGIRYLSAFFHSHTSCLPFLLAILFVASSGCIHVLVFLLCLILLPCWRPIVAQLPFVAYSFQW